LNIIFTYKWQVTELNEVVSKYTLFTSILFYFHLEDQFWESSRASHHFIIMSLKYEWKISFVSFLYCMILLTKNTIKFRHICRRYCSKVSDFNKKFSRKTWEFKQILFKILFLKLKDLDSIFQKFFYYILTYIALK